MAPKAHHGMAKAKAKAGVLRGPPPKAKAKAKAAAILVKPKLALKPPPPPFLPKAPVLPAHPDPHNPHNRWVCAKLESGCEKPDVKSEIEAVESPYMYCRRCEYYACGRCAEHLPDKTTRKQVSVRDLDHR